MADAAIVSMAVTHHETRFDWRHPLAAYLLGVSHYQLGAFVHCSSGPLDRACETQVDDRALESPAHMVESTWGN